MLKGIAASAGVSVAKVYKLETPKVVIEKSGSWFSYDGNRIGQGRENETE